MKEKYINICKRIIEICKIVMPFMKIPMWFVDRYEYHQLVAGDVPGTLDKIIHHQSMIDYLGHTIWPYLSIALLLASGVLSIAALKYSHLQKLSNVIFVVAILFFWLLEEIGPHVYFG